MKKNLLFLLIIIFILELPNFYIYSQTSSTTTSSATSNSSTIDVLSQDSWKYFYNVFRPAADVSCLQGSSVFEKINNCLIRVLSALQYLAVILFLISLTVIAGFLVFSPVRKDYLDIAKKTFFWTILGFIIIFIAREILQAINQLIR
ncbi:MAG: hypothetical protein KatS3mg094_557 [Candidatus Parcubacteria bacterium]|nr:MAG: hypothetical protein KatS3mg094_557 [Candidatus Parcubacteria bacterium]